MLDDRGCMTLGTPPANGFRVGWPGEIASLDKETLVSDLRYGRHPISGNSFNEKDPVLPKIIVTFTGPSFCSLNNAHKIVYAAKPLLWAILPRRTKTRIRRSEAGSVGSRIVPRI